MIKLEEDPCTQYNALKIQPWSWYWELLSLGLEVNIEKCH
jgi:hypothetical protein